MKRATLALVAAFAAIVATAETSRTATENWTRNRIAEATNATIAAAAQTATNYTDAATNAIAATIPAPYAPDPSDPDFSNAVVSVALLIGTNELAALRELGGLPVDAIGLGAVVLALAAAVAALRRAMLGAVERSQATDAAQSAALAAQARALTEVQEDAHAAKDKATEAHDRATEAAAGVEELKDASDRSQATDAAQSAALAAQAAALTLLQVGGADDGSALSLYADQIERAARTGHGKQVASYYPQYAIAPALTFLHISDVHGSPRVTDAIKVLDYLVAKGSCRFLLVTGDIHSNTFASDYTAMAAAFASTSNPVYITAGNHDLGNIGYNVGDCPTNRQVYDRMFAPLVDRWNLHMADGSGATTHPDDPADYDPETDAVCSWATDFEEEKIRMIGLYAYDAKYEVDPNDSGRLLYRRGYHAMRQEEVDWFVNTLITTPEGFGVVIAMHDDVEVSGHLDSPFNFAQYQNFCDIFAHFGRSALCEIVQAFIDGAALSKSWPQATSGREPFSVNADFSDKNSGAHFVAWINGHRHADGINFLKNFPNQLELNVSKFVDPYSVDGRTDETMNLVSISVDRRRVSVTRIGRRYSDNGDGSMCDYIQLDYRGRNYQLGALDSVSAAVKDLAERDGASASIVTA